MYIDAFLEIRLSYLHSAVDRVANEIRLIRHWAFAL